MFSDPLGSGRFQVVRGVGQVGDVGLCSLRVPGFRVCGGGEIIRPFMMVSLCTASSVGLPASVGGMLVRGRMHTGSGPPAEC